MNMQTLSQSTSLSDDVPRVNVRTFPNHKPWVNGCVHAKLKARHAYRSGDPKALNVQILSSEGHQRCQNRLQGQVGVLTIIALTPDPYIFILLGLYICKSVSFLFLLFYLFLYCFIVLLCNLAQEFPSRLIKFYIILSYLIASHHRQQDDCTLSLTTAVMRKALKRINSWVSLGPDCIPGRVLRECADQLVEVFTSIFKLSLYQSAVPTCFSQTTFVPVPKKTSITCLNDYHPVALTPIISW